MQTAQQILDWSTIAVIVAAAIAAYSRTIAGIGATLGNRKFKYRFDKTQLPTCARAIMVLAILSFAYSLAVAKQADVAIIYGLIMTFFGGLGILLRIGYVPR